MIVDRGEMADRLAAQTWVESIRGLEVVISGDFRTDFNMTKKEMRERALGAGAKRASEDVRRSSDLFVKGESPMYKFDVYGDKEADLAARAPRAWVIDGWGFMALMAGGRARAWKPMQPRQVGY